MVEHPLKVFNERWYLEFTLGRACKSAHDAMAKAAEILGGLDVKSFENDLKTLPATLHSIVMNKGDWADAGLC